jgi:hypothetical protein
MAIVRVPERGTPLDVTYLYDLANAINNVSNSVSSATYNYTTVKTREASDQSIKTSESRIIAAYVDVVNNENMLAGTTRSFSYDYPSDFKYAPIATASPVNTGRTAVGNDVTIVLNSITTSRVEGEIKFSSTGTMSVSINLIIIGIPT